jgi:serine/threonine-protein kinase
MVTNDLGACEWFVWDLRRSALIDRGQLDQLVTEFLKRNPRAEAPQLAEHLVKQGTLTAFQAERILSQKTQGLVLGPYVLLDAIGQGSMGQVFKASSKNDNGFYAVKVLPRRSMWNVRLARRQVRSFGQFNHPAVVPFVDVGTAGGLHYLVWPLVDGQTLEQLVQQQGRLPAEQSARIGVQVAQGLHAAHHNNIFHGLLKPSNVMVGSDGQARLLDFGIGSLLVENEGESLVDTMSTANTLTSGLDCASPESVMDPTNRTPAGDQYSFGCTLYYCLTGRVPFPEGSAVEKMMAHQTKAPEPIPSFAPECPEGLVQVVTRLMAKNPAERFSGMDEVVEALEPYLGDLAESEEAAAAVAVAANVGSAGRMKGLGNPNAGKGNVTRGNFGAPPVQTPTPAAAKAGIGGASIARPAPGQKSSVSKIPTRTQPVPPPKPLPAPTPPKASRPAPLPTASRTNLGGRTMPPREVNLDDEVTLTPAAHGHYPDGPASYPDPSRLSANWVGGAATEPESRKKPAFGTLSIVAAGLMLAALVFLGARLIVQQ